MLVSLTCGKPPHFTFNRLPLSLTLRHTHFSGQSLWLISVFSANNKHTLAQTNNKIRKKLLGIMSSTSPEARSAYTLMSLFLLSLLLLLFSHYLTHNNILFFTNTTSKKKKSMQSVPAQTIKKTKKKHANPQQQIKNWRNENSCKKFKKICCGLFFLFYFTQ